jgi:hypothetical protein
MSDFGPLNEMVALQQSRQQATRRPTPTLRPSRPRGRHALADRLHALADRLDA